MSQSSRDQMLTVRLSDQERERLEEQATDQGKTVSEWVRDVLGGRREGSLRNRWKLAREVEKRILSLEQLPLVQLWLYGSVARGDADSDSDVDLLLVLDTPRERRTEWLEMVYDQVMELEWEHDIHISMQIYTVDMWEELRGSSFRTEVETVGLRLDKGGSARISGTSAA